MWGINAAHLPKKEHFKITFSQKLQYVIVQYEFFYTIFSLGKAPNWGIFKA
jgi:hypothetical protein